VIQDRRKQLVLAGEVVIDEAVRGPGRGGDVRDRGAPEAPLGEEREGRVDELCPAPIRLIP
jgi:hypothetical protein